MSRVFVVEHAVAGLEPGAEVGEEQLAHLQLDALLTGGFLSETAAYEPAVNRDRDSRPRRNPNRSQSRNPNRPHQKERS